MGIKEARNLKYMFSIKDKIASIMNMFSNKSIFDINTETWNRIEKLL